MMNGIMLALSISGIDLKAFALTTYFQKDEKNLIISLDANKTDNVLLVESNKPFKLKEYKDIIQIAQTEIAEIYQKFKRVLIKKLT
jgi:ribonuclease PH